MVKLGTVVKDKITGFEGVATARHEYLYGCVRIAVEPKVGPDGKLGEVQCFDEQRVDPDSDVTTGGPGDVPARRDPPHRR